MPLPGPTDKKKHWQSIVLTPLVTPGTYNNACVTVNEYGLVTGISSCPTAAFIVVDIPANLPGTGNPGDLAIVLDDSAGGDPSDPEALYVWDSDGSPGSPQWRRLASTALANQRVDYRQALVGIAPFTAIGATVDPGAIVKQVTVEIINPYPPGTSYIVRDSGPQNYMNSTLGDLNPQVAGTYTIDAFGSGNPVVGVQLEAVIGGGPPFGDSLVYVSYVN